MSPSCRRAPNRAAVLPLVVVLLLLAAPRPAHAAASAEIAGLANAERESRGLAALAWSGELARVAQEHAERMAAEGELSHSRIGSRVGGWQRIGENVGRASSASQVHQLWMGSSTHRANILDPAFTEIGVGAVERDGQLWVAAVYRLPSGVSPPAPAPPEADEPPAASAPPPRPADEPRAVAPEPEPRPAIVVPDRVVSTLARIELIEVSSRLLITHPWADAS